jgi:hypothetical protein
MVCEICSNDPNEPFLVNELEWRVHLNAKGHRRRLQSKRNRELNMKYISLKELRNQVTDNDFEVDQKTKVETYD